MIFKKSAATLSVSALAAALVVSAAPTAVNAQAGTGPVIGAYAQPIGGQSNIDAVVQLENTLGTTLPIVRAFNRWEDAIGADKPLHTFTRDGGRELAVSVKPTRDDGTDIPWADIADAQPGSTLYQEMQQMADALVRYDAPVIFTFHHEPEANSNRNFGTNEEFKAAFARIRAVFDAEGVTQARYAVVLTEWSFEVGDYSPNDRRRAELWVPGDDVVDIIGSDEYNWNNCRDVTINNDPWISLEDDMEPFLRFARQHPNKQLMLGEFGSDDGTPGQKAQWLAEAKTFFETSPEADRFAALLYFHDDGREEGWQQCNWWLDRNDDGSSNPGTTAQAIDWFSDDSFRGSFLDRLAPRSEHTCFGQPATRVGTQGDDTIVGTPGPDVIVGLGGNDIIQGLTGDDLICGGPGNDTIYGLGGEDTIHGQSGNDTIFGGYLPDVIYGGAGNDTISGEGGADELHGNDGSDEISGGQDGDSIYGEAGADRINGNRGYDTILGGKGTDTLLGGKGNDTIFGNLGTDTCTAGLGRDVLDCEVEK